MMLAERVTDIEHHKIARQVFDALTIAVKGKTVADLGMQIDRLESYPDVIFAHVPFSALGVKLPDALGELDFCVKIGRYNEDDDLEGGGSDEGTSISPGRVAFLPHGAICIGFNQENTREPQTSKFDSIGSNRAATRLAAKRQSFKKPLNVNVGQILHARQAVFIHEMIHQLDSNFRKDAAQMGAQMQKDLKAGRYIETQHEQNAYFIQAFEDIVETFREKHKQTQKNARKFAPTFEALWKRFEDHLWTNMRHHFAGVTRGKQRVPQYNNPKQNWMYIPKYTETPLALRRKFAARLKDLWDDYVASLPS